MGRSRKELEAIKKQVIELATLGYSGAQIGRDLDINERNVQRYIEDHRKSRTAEQSGKADVIIGELIDSQERRIRYLQGIIKEGTKAERMKALQLLQQEDNMKIKRHQLVGNLPSEAPMIAIQNTNVVEGVTTIADSIKRMHPELLNKFGGNKARSIDHQEKKE